MTKYSEVSYTYSGGSKVFTIPFSYLKTEHIKVYIDNTEAEDFEFNTSSQIQVNDTITSGQTVKIVRTTPIDSRMITFNDRSILNAQQQNLDSDQLFDVVQEVYDKNNNFTEEIQTEVNTANTNASTALSKATTALSNSNAAISTANTASTNATNAVNTANSASSTANTASTNATNAVNTANSASSTATAASNKVDELATDIATVIAAADKINQLETAVTTATNAASTATSAATTATNKAAEAASSASAATAKVGNLSDLTTTAKNTVVAAVNELNSNCEKTANKGQANGYCGLNSSGLIPANKIPDNFVLNSGDKMTGTLEFDKSLGGISYSQNPNMIMHLNHTIDANSLPANHIYGNGRIMVDNANKRCFREYDRYSTGGAYAHNIQITNYDEQGNSHDATLSMTVNKDGSTNFSFPKCETEPTTTSSAASNKVAVVVENYVNSNSWYRKWSDGFIEQGGYMSNVSDGQVIKLLKNYTTANYSISITTYATSTTAAYSVMYKTSTKTTSSFAILKREPATEGIMWQTYGY